MPPPAAVMTLYIHDMHLLQQTFLAPDACCVILGTYAGHKVPELCCPLAPHAVCCLDDTRIFDPVSKTHVVL